MRRAPFAPSKVAALVALGPIVLLLAGCRDKNQSPLAPASHSSADIASLFWWMMGGAFLGLAFVVALLVWAWKRRARRGFGSDTTGDKPGERRAVTIVVVFGIVTPIVLLALLFVISDIFVIQTTEAPAATATTRTIVVTAHQWWWEASYPGTSAVTANEIHIPTGVPVRVLVRSPDVIHSFWVPRLNRTIDVIPGRTNQVELYADEPGRYRGQCDEFCGLQHAHMAFYVFADPPAVFRRWLANEESSAALPRSREAKVGRREFVNGSCQSCHTIRGTDAQGDVGPDLTHLATRTTIAALTLPNSRASLAHWVVDAQGVKPGNKMPDIELGARQLRTLLAYLESLK